MKKKIRFIKRNWIFFVAEIFAIAAVIFAGRFLYLRDLEVERARFNEYCYRLENFSAELEEVTNVYDLLAYFNELTDSYNRTGESKNGYGFHVRMYDSDMREIYRSVGKNLVIAFYEDSKPGSRKTMIQLDECFPKEELDKMLEFYYLDKEEATAFELAHSEPGGQKAGVYVRRMKGYYDSEDKFVPAEIEFGDIYDSKARCIIQNPETKGKASEENLVKLYQKKTVPQYTVPETVQGELVNIDFSFVNHAFSSQERAEDVYNREWLYKQREIDSIGSMLMYTMEESAEWTGSNTQELEGSPEFDYYDIAAYADLREEVLATEDYKRDIIPTVIWGQCMAFSVWVLFVFFRKKSKKMKDMKTTFLNAMAHEMKTPAAVIKNSAECIREGIHPEKHDHYLEIIDRESDRMSHLLNSMLTYTRLTNSEYNIQWTKVDVTEIAKNLCEWNQNLIEEKEVKTNFNIVREFEVEGDQRLMEMVLDNFISNAIRHCEKGGEIRITSKVNGIWIYNTGSHIPEKEMKQIWEPMYQVDSARSGESKSSGMGLAISEEILQLHRLRYGVTNVAGGVEFYIWNDRY